MNEFAEILNLFIANVIAVYHIRRDINKYKSNKDKQ